jgi:hypothetical protein
VTLLLSAKTLYLRFGDGSPGRRTLHYHGGQKVEDSGAEITQWQQPQCEEPEGPDGVGHRRGHDADITEEGMMNDVE